MDDLVHISLVCHVLVCGHVCLCAHRQAYMAQLGRFPDEFSSPNTRFLPHVEEVPSATVTFSDFTLKRKQRDLKESER